MTVFEPENPVASLRSTLQKQFTIVQREVAVGSHTIQLTSPADMDHLLDELASRPSTDADVADERLPYWAELWPSAVALAGHIAARDSELRDVQAVELGCGLGLVGIAAGLRGAQVLLTDYIPAALHFAALNWWDNLAVPPTIRQLDWRTPDPDLRADLLLAADIIYEERAFEPVLRAFDSLLSPHGRILLSEPQRRIAHNFFRKIEQSGFLIHQRVLCPNAIGIYEITRA